MKRHKIGMAASKRLFTKTRSRTHKKNVLGANPMRGGIRL